MRHTVFRRQRPMWVPPLVFSLFLALGGFPAGLFVYWIASNLITLCRNHLVYRHGPRQTTRKEDVPAEERDVGANDEKTARGSVSSGGTTGQRRSRKRSAKSASRSPILRPTPAAFALGRQPGIHPTLFAADVNPHVPVTHGHQYTGDPLGGVSPEAPAINHYLRTLTR